MSVIKFFMAVSTVLIAGQALSEASEYTDEDIKAKYKFISCLVHGDENGSHIRKALSMSGNDTNRFARVLRELAVENTNQTEYVIRTLGRYKTTESLPFLYAYATNDLLGAEALKSIFAIEGVTSNSVEAMGCYLAVTNSIPPIADYSRSEVCEWLLRKVHSTPELSVFRSQCFGMALNYAQNISTMHISLDKALLDVSPSYRYSKRRLSVMRSAQNRCWNELLTNYVTNAINELVAYPEADQPD